MITNVPNAQNKWAGSDNPEPEWNGEMLLVEVRVCAKSGGISKPMIKAERV